MLCQSQGCPLKIHSQTQTHILQHHQKERKALHKLRKDDNCTVFIADKRVVLVIIDKDVYSFS